MLLTRQLRISYLHLKTNFIFSQTTPFSCPPFLEYLRPHALIPLRLWHYSIDLFSCTAASMLNKLTHLHILTYLLTLSNVLATRPSSSWPTAQSTKHHLSYCFMRPLKPLNNKVINEWATEIVFITENKSIAIKSNNHGKAILQLKRKQ